MRVWWYLLKKGPMLVPEEHCLSRWFYTAELVGRQVTTGKPKKSFHYLHLILGFWFLEIFSFHLRMLVCVLQTGTIFLG